MPIYFTGRKTMNGIRNAENHSQEGQERKSYLVEQRMGMLVRLTYNAAVYAYAGFDRPLRLKYIHAIAHLPVQNQIHI